MVYSQVPLVRISIGSRWPSDPSEFMFPCDCEEIQHIMSTLHKHPVSHLHLLAILKHTVLPWVWGWCCTRGKAALRLLCRGFAMPAEGATSCLS